VKLLNFVSFTTNPTAHLDLIHTGHSTNCVKTP